MFQLTECVLRQVSVFLNDVYINKNHKNNIAEQTKVLNCIKNQIKNYHDNLMETPKIDELFTKKGLLQIIMDKAIFVDMNRNVLGLQLLSLIDLQTVGSTCLDLYFYLTYIANTLCLLYYLINQTNENDESLKFIHTLNLSDSEKRLFLSAIFLLKDFSQEKKLAYAQSLQPNLSSDQYQQYLGSPQELLQKFLSLIFFKTKLEITQEMLFLRFHDNYTQLQDMQKMLRKESPHGSFNDDKLNSFYLELSKQNINTNIQKDKNKQQITSPNTTESKKTPQQELQSEAQEIGQQIKTYQDNRGYLNETYNKINAKINLLKQPTQNDNENKDIESQKLQYIESQQKLQELAQFQNQIIKIYQDAI